MAGLFMTFGAVMVLSDYGTGRATRIQLIAVLTLLVPGALIAFAVSPILRFVETRTYRAHLPLRQPIPQPPCCSHPRLRKLPILPFRKYPCPTCQNRTLTARYVGKS